MHLGREHRLAEADSRPHQDRRRRVFLDHALQDEAEV